MSKTKDRSNSPSSQPRASTASSADEAAALRLLAEALQRAIVRRDQAIEKLDLMMAADRRALAQMRSDLDRFVAKLDELSSGLDRRAAVGRELRRELRELQAPASKQSTGDRDELLKILGETRVALRRVSAERDRLRDKLAATDAMYIETTVLGDEYAPQAVDHTLPSIEALMSGPDLRAGDSAASADHQTLAGGLEEAIEELIAPELMISDEEPAACEPGDAARRRLTALQAGAAAHHALRKDVILIGRSPTADIHLDHESVSRVHARLLVSKSEVVVEDMSSKNGVEVNAKKVSRHSLRDGDVLRIGTLRFQFVDEALSAR